MLLPRYLLFKAVGRLSNPIQGGLQQFAISISRTINVQTYFISQRESEAFRENTNLINLAKNVSNSVTNSFQEEKFITKFNLTKEILEHFRVISNTGEGTDECEKSIWALRKRLDDDAIGILEEVCRQFVHVLSTKSLTH